MANYNATNSLSDIVESNPTGAEDSGKVDDVLRETRTVFKTVISKIHSPLGELRLCVYKEKPTLSAGGSYPAPSSINTWLSKAANMQRVVNLGSVDQSAVTGIVRPVAGTYLVLASGVGCQIGRTQIRIYNTTDSLPVANCYGHVAWAVDRDLTNYQDQGSQAESLMFGIITTDGTKNYRLEQIHQLNNTVSGWGIGASNTGAWSGTENVFSQMLFLKIG